MGGHTCFCLQSRSVFNGGCRRCFPLFLFYFNNSLFFYFAATRVPLAFHAFEKVLYISLTSPLQLLKHEKGDYQIEQDLQSRQIKSSLVPFPVSRASHFHRQCRCKGCRFRSIPTHTTNSRRLPFRRATSRTRQLPRHQRLR